MLVQINQDLREEMKTCMESLDAHKSAFQEARELRAKVELQELSIQRYSRQTLRLAARLHVLQVRLYCSWTLQLCPLAIPFTLLWAVFVSNRVPKQRQMQDQHPGSVGSKPDAQATDGTAGREQGTVSPSCPKPPEAMTQAETTSTQNVTASVVTATESPSADKAVEEPDLQDN
jgi:hypothetical protein